MVRYHKRVWLQIIGIVIIALGATFIFTTTVYAADGFVPLAKVSGFRLDDLYSDTSGDLSEFINNLFSFALSIGAILAVLRIAWGGYLYMTTDLWSTKERAREVLRETVLGLLLLLAVWTILHQINPDILKLDVLQILKGNPAPTAQAPTEAGLSLMEQYVGDTVTPPTDYTRSVGPTRLPGYYCYLSSVSPGNYACLTNEANCNELARAENTVCTFAPPDEPATEENTPQIFNSADSIPSGQHCFGVINDPTPATKYYCLPTLQACQQSALEFGSRSGTSGYTCNPH